MDAAKGIITCDYCRAEFDSKEINFDKKEAEIEGKKLEAVYFRCPHCNHPYLISILDFQGKKLQDQYIHAEDSYRKMCRSSFPNEVRLSQKLKKAQELKEKALNYVHGMLQEYGELLSEELFKTE